jgi:hypothetical protein
MDKLAGPFFALAFIALIGMGLLTYMTRADLAKASAALAAVEKNRDDFKVKLDDVTRKSATSAVALDSCNVQLKDAQAQLEAKKTARR